MFLVLIFSYQSLVVFMEVKITLFSHLGWWICYRRKENLCKHLESSKDDFITTKEVEIISKALSVINLLIKDTTIPFVKRLTGPHDCWEYFEKKYEFKSSYRKMMLMKKIVFMKKKKVVCTTTSRRLRKHWTN